MPLTSDITISVSKFGPSAIPDQTNKFNEAVIEKLKGGPRWFEVGAAKYREMRKTGQTTLPAPIVLPEGIDIKIPSRDSGRDIPCRVMYPSSRTSPEERKKCKGVVCHFHGGGWTLADEKSTDTLLKHYADSGDLAVVSIGYRHAPEDPFPKGPQDCIDGAEYLVKNSEKEFGAPLKFIGGESAGGHLSLLVTFHLLKTQPSLKLSGLLLHFGCYDLSELPQARHFSKPLVLDLEIMDHFIKAFVPGMSVEERKDPSVSPFYEDIEKLRGKLPSALFTCGTEDPLLDDSMFMATKWLMTGGEAIVKIYPGAAHGFIAFPTSMLKESGEALQDTATYIRDRLAKS